MEEIKLVKPENELFIVFDFIEEVYIEILFQKLRTFLPQIIFRELFQHIGLFSLIINVFGYSY